MVSHSISVALLKYMDNHTLSLICKRVPDVNFPSRKKDRKLIVVPDDFRISDELLTFLVVAEAIQSHPELRTRETVGIALKLLREVEHRISCEKNAEPNVSIQFLKSELLWHVAYNYQIDSADNFEEAIRALRFPSACYDRNRHPMKWAWVRHSLAHLYIERIQGDRERNLTEAVKNLESCLEVYSQSEHAADWASVMITLANTHACRSSGDASENIERSIYCLEQALSVYTKENNPGRWAAVQINLGTTYMHRIRGVPGENIEKTIQCYRNALTVHSFDTAPRKWVMINNNLGNAFSRRVFGDPQENLEESIAYYKKAIERMPDPRPERFYAMILHNLGYNYKKRKAGSNDIETALGYCLEALDLCEKSYPMDAAMIHSTLAGLYRERKIADPHENLAQARKHYKAALGMFTPRSAPAENIENNLRLSEIERVSDHDNKAREALHQATESFENLYRQSITYEGRAIVLEKGVPAFFRAAFCAAESNEIERGFEYLELGKARFLSDMLAVDRGILNASGSLKQRYETVMKAVRELNFSQQQAEVSKEAYLETSKKIKALNQELNAVTGKIREIFPTFIRKTPALADMANLITTPYTSFISFCISDFGSVIFTVTRGAERTVTESFIFHDFTSEDLERIKLDWRSAYRNLQLDQCSDKRIALWEKDVKRNLRALYEKLFRPVDVALKEQGIERIILCPNKLLHIIPLHLMRSEIRTGKPYLFEKYEISYIPSVSLFHAVKQTGIDSDVKLTAIANPTLDLRYAEAEVEEISKLFVDSVVLNGRRAEKKNVISAALNAECIHFACHSKFDSSHPERSGLILAPSPLSGSDPEESNASMPSCANVSRSLYVSVKPPLPREQILTLPDIVHTLRLDKTKLVVLSSCESGVFSTDGTADEYGGLPAAFIEAGAKTIVSTLWFADDRRTHELSLKFYRNLIGKKMRPAAALRNTQIEMVKKGLSFYFWGGFIITGV